MSQAFLRISETCLAHKSSITEPRWKKIDMTISHLFHKNYLEHNGVIPQAKDTFNPDKTLKRLPVWSNKRAMVLPSNCGKPQNITTFKRSILKHCPFPVSEDLWSSTTVTKSYHLLKTYTLVPYHVTQYVTGLWIFSFKWWSPNPYFQWPLANNTEIGVYSWTHSVDSQDCYPLVCWA